MTSATDNQLRCLVEGEEYLPSDLGGEAGVCSTISAEVMGALSQAGLSREAVVITVRVKSPHRLSASASVKGKQLPEQQLAVSDRPINRRSIEMVGQALAGELAKASE